LLERKADAKIVDVRGFTALHHAAMIGNVELLALLLPHVPIDSVSGAGETGLHVTLMNELWDAALFLLQHGASPRRQMSEGMTPLHLLADGYDEKSDACKRLLQGFLYAGCDLNVLDEDGRTPLAIALKMGKPMLAKELTRHGGRT